MHPSTTGVIGIYLYDVINLTTSIYSVINVLRFFSRIKGLNVNLFSCSQ